MNVLDLLAGGGYFTDILSNAVGANGKVHSHNTRLFLKFEAKPYEAHFKTGRLTNVTRIEQELGDLRLPGSLDMILMSMVWHDTYYSVPAEGMPATDRPAVLAKLYAALKPGGVLAVIDHSAQTGHGSADAQKLHRLDEALLKKDVATAGFVLDGESNLLRNASDDRSLPVFDDKIRGKTDRFVLRFRKPS
jgi:predicted methyltransferase